MTIWKSICKVATHNYKGRKWKLQSVAKICMCATSCCLNSMEEELLLGELHCKARLAKFSGMVVVVVNLPPEGSVLNLPRLPCNSKEALSKAVLADMRSNKNNLLETVAAVEVVMKQSRSAFPLYRTRVSQRLANKMQKTGNKKCRSIKLVLSTTPWHWSLWGKPALL